MVLLNENRVIYQCFKLFDQVQSIHSDQPSDGCLVKTPTNHVIKAFNSKTSPS